MARDDKWWLVWGVVESCADLALLLYDMIHHSVVTQLRTERYTSLLYL